MSARVVSKRISWRLSDLGEQINREEELKKIPLRVWRRPEDSWVPCSLKLEAEKGCNRRYAVVYDEEEREMKRVFLECTSYVLETILTNNSFEIVTMDRILHFSTSSAEATTKWISSLKAFISKCDPFPTDPLLKESLIRHPGSNYTVKLLEKKTLGVVFSRSAGEWANVRESQNPAIQPGSVLSAINGTN